MVIAAQVLAENFANLLSEKRMFNVLFVARVFSRRLKPMDARKTPQFGESA
jgi:hypothetical protein